VVEPAPDSDQLRLARGIAQLLHDLELGVYDPDEVYPVAADEQVRGIITSGRVPTLFPDCIVISVAPFTRTSRTTGYWAAQLYIRIEGHQKLAANVGAQIRDQLEGLTHAYLNDIGVREITYRSADELGQDTQHRGEFALNLLFHGRKPIINRPQIGA
jgi:hypothetical protein